MLKRQEDLKLFSQRGLFDWTPHPGPFMQGLDAHTVLYLGEWRDASIKIAQLEAPILSMASSTKDKKRLDLFVFFDVPRPCHFSNEFEKGFTV
jgi:hypothetical protein